MSTIVSWNLQLNVRDGQLETFRSLMEEMTKATQSDEPGTLAYEWFLSEDDTICHLYERYADAKAVMAHLGNFGSKFMARFMDCLEPTGFHVYGNPNDEARGVLDGFGAVYFRSFGGFSR
jgi:quinol monooxygenase YgiN